MSDKDKRHGEAAITPFWDKAISAIWIAFLAVLAVNLIGNKVFHGTLLMEEPEHHEAEAKFGYPIEVVDETGSAAAGPAQRVSAVPMIATATVAAGAEVFRKCAACHTAEAGGANKTGPNLHNIVGDAIGDRNGFKTTDSLKAIAAGKWDYATLDDYLEDPKHLAPKGSMSFAGLKKPEDRAAVIKFLMSNTENPPPLPAGE
ncbi:MAG: c-type cytochrome [Rhodospirillaceae bacterium]|nr:c-type cytochrome [Rhodospirillaceae bacterium]